jgi:hypothetical protein
MTHMKRKAAIFTRDKFYPICNECGETGDDCELYGCGERLRREQALRRNLAKDNIEYVKKHSNRVHPIFGPLLAALGGEITSDMNNAEPRRNVSEDDFRLSER